MSRSNLGNRHSAGSKLSAAFMVISTQSFETLECRLFRDGVQLCTGLVDLVVCIRHHGGGTHRLALAGERFVGLVAEDVAEVGDRGGDFGDFRPREKTRELVHAWTGLVKCPLAFSQQRLHRTRKLHTSTCPLSCRYRVFSRSAGYRAAVARKWGWWVPKYKYCSGFPLIRRARQRRVSWVGGVKGSLGTRRCSGGGSPYGRSGNRPLARHAGTSQNIDLWPKLCPSPKRKPTCPNWPNASNLSMRVSSSRATDGRHSYW